MISIILPQTPLLNTLSCTLIWCRVISHWICVLASVFVCASLLLLSKCVWNAKLLFRDYCFPSQRSKFAFTSLIFDSYFGPEIELPGSLCFILVSSGAHSTIWIRLGQKNPKYPEWQTIIGVKISRPCGTSLFCSAQNHNESCSWCHSRGQGRQDVGRGSSTILLLLPWKQKVLPYCPQISSCSSVLVISFSRPRTKFVSASEKQGTFFFLKIEALSALQFP